MATFEFTLPTRRPQRRLRLSPTSTRQFSTSNALCASKKGSLSTLTRDSDRIDFLGKYVLDASLH